jgi:hypothetical protein
MIRLPNHVDEHAAMREALAKLEYSARPVDAAPREPLEFRPRPSRQPEEASRLWLLVGLACLLGSAAVVCGLVLLLVSLLGPDGERELVRVLVLGGLLIAGSAAVAEALYQMEQKR